MLSLQSSCTVGKSVLEAINKFSDKIIGIILADVHKTKLLDNNDLTSDRTE